MRLINNLIKKKHYKKIKCPLKKKKKQKRKKRGKKGKKQKKKANRPQVTLQVQLPHEFITIGIYALHQRKEEWILSRCI